MLHFADQVHVVKDNLFPTPPLFKLIQDSSGTDWKEMYQVCIQVSMFCIV